MHYYFNHSILRFEDLTPDKITYYYTSFSNRKYFYMPSIKEIKPKQLVAGITGYYAHGKDLTFGYVEIKKGADLAAHKHIHEQITYVIEGELDMTIGGEFVPLRPGMFHVIPSNTLHSAVAKTDCIAIDVFNPVREDYK
jgi:quercetin dioxygenase-like cupin family protein